MLKDKKNINTYGMTVKKKIYPNSKKKFHVPKLKIKNKHITYFTTHVPKQVKRLSYRPTTTLFINCENEKP